MGSLQFSVLIRDISTQQTVLNSSEKPTGQHILSLLIFFIVPIYIVRQKRGKNA